MPLANDYRLPDEKSPERSFPLHARVCPNCFLVQVDDSVPPDAIFSDYAYFSSYSDSWVAHAKRYADFLTLEAELQEKRISAFRAFGRDVAGGTYPEAKHQVDMDDAAYDRFLTLAQSL